MADGSPQRLWPTSTASSSSSGGTHPDDDNAPLRLPVLLYVPNLIGYARLLLSLYGLSIVAHTVQQEDARHAAHDGGSSCSVQAMMQTATFYATQISNTGLLPPVANTLLGKGLGHVALRGGGSNRHWGNDGDGPAFLPNEYSQIEGFFHCFRFF